MGGEIIVPGFLIRYLEGVVLIIAIIKGLPLPQYVSYI